MDIKSKVRLNCVKCGGAKYSDDPYLLNGVMHTDVICLMCGDLKSIELDRFNKMVVQLNKGLGRK